MSKATDTEAELDVSLEINGQEVQARKGETILEASRRADIEIPTLCEYEGLTNVGACRMCLVEVDGKRMETACTTAVSDDMEIEVDTDRLWDHRKTLLELMFSEENHYCMYCELEGDCELEDLFNRAGLDRDRFPLEFEEREVDTSDPYVTLDRDRCILCGRCVRMCDEVVGNETLNFGNRGREAKIIADGDVALGDSTCVSCGACAQACPTGAIYDTYGAYKGRDEELDTVVTTCSECSVGCEVEVAVNSGRIVRVDGVEDGADGGQLCRKGRFELLMDDRERVKSATVRRNGSEVSVSVHEAMDEAADALADADDVQAYASGRLPAETLSAFADAMGEYGATVELPGAGRYATEQRIVAQVCEHLDVDAADVYADSAEAVLDADTVVVYDTGIVDTQPVVASYVRRAAKGGAELMTVDSGENQLERFADVSVSVGDPMSRLAENMMNVLGDGMDPEQADVLLDSPGAGGVAPRLVDGDSVIVVGPSVTDETTLLNVFALAAMSGSRVVSLNPVSNQVHEAIDAEVAEGHPEVAYLLAGDDRDEDEIDRMLDVARYADTVVVQATRESVLTDIADVVVPALDWFERSGTFVDVDGAENEIAGVLEPRAPVDSDRELIAELTEVNA